MNYLYSLHQTPDPCYSAGSWRRIVVYGRLILEYHEDLLDLLQIRRVSVEQVNVFLFQVRLYDFALKEALERVQQLESPENGHCVIESLRYDAGETALKLVDLTAEQVKVLVEGLGVHVHDIVLGVHKYLDRREKVGVGLPNRVGQHLALGSANLDPPVSAQL